MVSKFIEYEINKLEKPKLNLEAISVSTKKLQYIAIPYIKKISEKFGRQVTKILDLIGIQTRIAFSTVKVGSYFSLKDSISKKFSSCLVYKFTCPGDLDTQYIGETERQLFLRIKEHTTPTNSSVFSHY